MNRVVCVTIECSGSECEQTPWKNQTGSDGCKNIHAWCRHIGLPVFKLSTTRPQMKLDIDLLQDFGREREGSKDKRKK